MNKQYTFTIRTEYAQKTIQQFLLLHGFSQKIITHLKKDPSAILVNGSGAYTNYRLCLGDCLLISIFEKENLIVPSYFDDDAAMQHLIAYEDDDLIVINKPAGMPIHPSQGHYEHTLANYLTGYYKQKNEPFVFRAINRLDRDTSGLLLVAKHMLSSAQLSLQVREGTIKRSYVAIVAGCVKEPFTINEPIARKDGSTIERMVSSNGEDATTIITPLSSNHSYSIVQCELLTGRTHQIRVHMAYAGFPLIGDFLYNPSSKEMDRQALHSHSLTFYHPFQKKVMNFIADYPIDMVQFIKTYDL